MATCFKVSKRGTVYEGQSWSNGSKYFATIYHKGMCFDASLQGRDGGRNGYAREAQAVEEMAIEKMDAFLREHPAQDDASRAPVGFTGSENEKSAIVKALKKIAEANNSFGTQGLLCLYPEEDGSISCLYEGEQRAEEAIMPPLSKVETHALASAGLRGELVAFQDKHVACQYMHHGGEEWRRLI